jgi:HlyD family secretion protein
VKTLISSGSCRVALVIMLLSALFLSSCRGTSVREEKSAAVVETVDVVQVVEKMVPSGTEYTGNVTSEKTALVSPKVMALIEDMTVKEGDLVDQGQLLAKLDGRDIEAKVMQARAGVSQAEAAYRRAEGAISQAEASYRRSLAGIEEGKGAMIQAQANLELSQKNLARFKDLYEEQSVPLARFEEVQAQHKYALSSVEQVKGRIAQAQAGKNEALAGKKQAEAALEEALAGRRQAQAQVDSASIMLSYTSIYAPFKGVVTKKFYETGAMASPGQPLLKIESLSYLQLEVPIPEGRVKDLPLGRRVTVSIDALNRTIRGTVRTCIPSGDPSTHTFKAKVDLPAVAGLMPAMYGRIMLDGENRTVLTVPAESLVARGKTTGVFKVVSEKGGDVALFIPVETGPKAQDEVEILRGLAAQDQVIISPPGMLVDGQPVKTRKKGS